MKALCITGANNAVLKDIATPFYRAGMQRPASLQREQNIDFGRWHQMAGGALKANKPLGKIWENLASDLILANLESDCWGWYEEHSVAALDFWAELEPNIHFLLVCTRPEQELEEKVATADSSLNAEQWLTAWYDRHRQMLDFYLKYPDRCLLIDAAAALQHINGQLQLAHQQWQLPLNTSQLSPEGAEQKSESASSLVVYSEYAQQGEIASWITRELIKNSPNNIPAFYAELQAAQYPFAGQQTDERANELVSWLNTQLDGSRLQGLLQDYQRLHKLASNNEQLLALQAEKNTTEQELEQARQENELLLLQLHQVQEELENTFLRKQTLEQEIQKAGQQQQELQTKLTAVQTSEQQHKSWVLKLKNELELAGQNSINKQALENIKQENELLMLQLHQVQEELESTFLNKQKLEQEIKLANQQQQELQTKLTTIQASEQKNKALVKDLEKQLEQAKQNSSNPQELEEAKQENELLLLQLHQVQEELEHYFLHHQQATKEKEQLAAENRRLKQQLNQAEQLIAEQPAGLLNKLRKKQQPQPQLKYDQVQLQHEQVNPDYEHIWIKLKNASFGSQLAGEWSFRLSCAGVRPGDFGNQPKLELPEQQEQLLQHWFAESESDHGRKLELRFALPNAMDGSVWKKLHVQDQQFIRGLVAQLPALLDELKAQGRRLSRSWDDWHKLAADMQRILAGRVKK